MTESTHTERLITTYRRRLHLLEEQQAFYGMRTDPAVTMEIEEIQQRLVTLHQQHEQPVRHAPVLRSLVPEMEQPPKKRGLLVLVGTGRENTDPMSQSAGAAIQYHLASASAPGLEFCWLIPSGLEETPSEGMQQRREQAAVAVARALAAVCAAHRVTASIWPVVEAFSIQATHDLVQWLFTHQVTPAGLNEHEVICDFTGGTKLMSAGMILACGHRWPMQYMVRDQSHGSTPLFVRFAPAGE